MHSFLVEGTIPFCVHWFVDVIGMDFCISYLGGLRYNFFCKNNKEKQLFFVFPLHLQS